MYFWVTLQESGVYVRSIHLHEEFYHPETLKQLALLLEGGRLSTRNIFADYVVDWFKSHYPCTHCLLTHSCTDALEMIALILNLKEGDEVIVPSFTYVSTANAFRLRTSQIRFADCLPERPVVDLSTLEELVTPHTKAIVVVHYAGIAVDMPPLVDFCNAHQIALVEDAAHALGATYLNKPLGSFGDFASLSFHYTKPVSCGEGGCLLLNSDRWIEKADVVYEKGTNKRLYDQKQVAQYEWLDLGSSFAMSAPQTCILKSQLQHSADILAQRKNIWDRYMDLLTPVSQSGAFELPVIPAHNQVNGSYFYITLTDATHRANLIAHLKSFGIESAFHYLALHRSPFYANQRNQRLTNTDAFESKLLRLPIHPALSLNQLEFVVSKITSYFNGSS